MNGCHTTVQTGLLIVIIFCVLFITNNSFADSIVIHGLSYHSNDKVYNEVNTGIGYRINDTDHMLSAGYYKNSLYRDSFYIGGGFELASSDAFKIMLVGGAISGYKNILPFVFPEIDIKISENVSALITYIPNPNGQVFGFSISIGL